MFSSFFNLQINRAWPCLLLVRSQILVFYCECSKFKWCQNFQTPPLVIVIQRFQSEQCFWILLDSSSQFWALNRLIPMVFHKTLSSTFVCVAILNWSKPIDYISMVLAWNQRVKFRLWASLLWNLDWVMGCNSPEKLNTDSVSKPEILLFSFSPFQILQN
jgi:hypothetical protein